MAFLEQASTLIKDQALVDAARDVKLYADYVAGKHGQIASDLLLTAVWCCLNPSVVGKRAALYRGQKASQNAKRSKAKTENARKKDKANIKENANTERKGSAEKERSQDPKAKDDGKMQDGIGGQQYFDMDCLEVDNEANVDQLSDESVRKPNTSDSINDTIVNEMDEQNKLEKRQLASNVDSSPLKGDSFEVYAIEDKTVATAEVIDLDSDTEAVISKPRPVSDTDENSDNADLSETVGNESATDPETGGDMSKNSFSDFEQSHGNTGSSVYQTTSDLETYASPACIPGLVPVSQTYTSRSRRKLQHTVKYEEAEIDNALYEMQEAERDDYEEDEPMAKGQQIITVKEECNYSGVGDESADQSNLYQPAYQDPCSSQQTFCQPVFVCPAPKRRLLDHDKKWNSQPDFSPDQLKYLTFSHGIDKNDDGEDVALKRKFPGAVHFNMKPESITMPGVYNSVSSFQLNPTVSVEHLESDLNINYYYNNPGLFVNTEENTSIGYAVAVENDTTYVKDFVHVKKRGRPKVSLLKQKGQSSSGYKKKGPKDKTAVRGKKGNDQTKKHGKACKLKKSKSTIEDTLVKSKIRSSRDKHKIGFYSVKKRSSGRNVSSKKTKSSSGVATRKASLKSKKDMDKTKDQKKLVKRGRPRSVGVNKRAPGRNASSSGGSGVKRKIVERGKKKESNIKGSSNASTRRGKQKRGISGKDAEKSKSENKDKSKSLSKRPEKTSKTNVEAGNPENDFDESDVIWID